jgi:HlyD family secretion protein
MTRKTVTLVLLVLMASITVGAFYSRHTASISAPFTERATRGDIVSTVAATGTLNAVTTVQVGSEISGIIEFLGADFNAIVRKGEILARLDPSIYQTTLEQARAALMSAEADAERYRVAQAAADSALGRARELHAQELMTDSDFQAAETDSESAAAQVESAEAIIRQARSAVDMAQVNLSKTVIESPIDGVVIARSVDVGQTVSASISAPTLFVIAADLTKMQVEASIDESDIGRVTPGQFVSFHVDAFPDETFIGKVLQVRLNPTIDSNVVTYITIIDAPNADLKLKPGMTAAVSIVVGRRDNVLRVPASALKFKPSPDVLARFGDRGATLPPAKSNTVWISNGTTISPAPVTTGASDGVYTEILSAPFGDGTPVVTRMSTTTAAVPVAAGTAGSPLLPGRPPGFPGRSGL